MRRFIKLIAVLAILVIAAKVYAATRVRPNLVVFIADDHGYLDTSLAGAKQFPTPNLQRLAT